MRLRWAGCAMSRARRRICRFMGTWKARTRECARISSDVYGSDAEEIRALAQDPALAAQLHPDLPYIAAEVVWAARDEMARTVEDVLARRTRALFLNAGGDRDGRAGGQAAGGGTGTR